MGIRYATSAVLGALLALLAGCGGGDRVPNTELLITTVPEDGATVTIAGEVRGETPLTITGLPEGNVQVLVEKEGFKPQGASISLHAGTPGTLEIEMDQRSGYLSIDCEPQGAEVWLNGEKIGTTPIVDRAIKLGEHRYELRFPNYVTTEKTFVVEEDFKYPFKHVLEPMKAKLTVVSLPSGASVWLNDQPEAQRTPLQVEVSPGTYTIGLQASGYILSEETVTLQPNEARTVEVRLQPGAVPPGMTLVPAGPFIMGESDGAPDERPQREETLPAFYIDRFEVTNQEFAQVFPSHTYTKGQEQWPASGVSFNQAQEYAQRVGKRLPTEAEWEKAARGTDGREYPWGDEWNSEYANTAERGADKTEKIGRTRLGSSPYGCIDMAGNVYEWTSTLYDRYPNNTDITKDYGQVFRVLRGGSYATERYEARCARRHFDRPDTARPDYGFRCAADISVTERRR